MRRFINEQDDDVVAQKAKEIAELHHAGEALDREEAPLKDKPDLISWIDDNVASLEKQTDLFDASRIGGAVLIRDQWDSAEPEGPEPGEVPDPPAGQI